MTYASSYGNGNFAGDHGGTFNTDPFTQLGAVNIIDSALASATKSGYNYLGADIPRTGSMPASFCGRGEPTTMTGITATGIRCFGVSTNGVIMTNTAGGNNCGCAIDASGAAFNDLSSPMP